MPNQPCPTAGGRRSFPCVPSCWSKALECPAAWLLAHSSPYTDGVRMEEIVEGCTGALHPRPGSHEPHGDLQLSTVPCLYAPLLLGGEHPARGRWGCCASWPQDKERRTPLTRRAPRPHSWSYCTHSRNEGTATYAAAVLFRISSEDKGRLPQTGVCGAH